MPSPRGAILVILECYSRGVARGCYTRKRDMRYTISNVDTYFVA